MEEKNLVVAIISTCITYEAHRKIKDMHWKVPELIYLGIKAKEDNPQLLKRINELETENANLGGKIQRLARRLYDVEAGTDEKN